MTDGKPILAQLRSRDPQVRAAARERMREVVARHAGDEKAAAAELRISVRTLRKHLEEPREKSAKSERVVTTVAPSVAPGPMPASVPVSASSDATPPTPRTAPALPSTAMRGAAVAQRWPSEDEPSAPTAPQRVFEPIAAPEPQPRGVLRFPAAGTRSPFADFQAWHRRPLGDQGSSRAAASAIPSPLTESLQPSEGTPPRSDIGAPSTSAESDRAAASQPGAAVHVAVTAPNAAAATTAAPRPLVAVGAGEWPHHQPDALVVDDGAAAAEPAERRLAFVLHMHLPWVLGHGRWPHGEDWLAEAVAHCYLPLVVALRRLAARGGRHLLTASVSPVLAAQLADPRTPPLVTGYLEHRRDAARGLASEHPLARWWESTYERLLADWNALGADLLAALRTMAADDVVELSTCAATHGYLPLLHRQEHVALQLAAARANHERWFGAPPNGLWMPECAYRPAGSWRHPATGAEEAERPGNETFLAAAGVRWTVVDAHLLLGGDPLVPYPELWGAGEGDDAAAEPPPPIGRRLQPRLVGTSDVAALPREPHTAHQVWSRHGGYPGDPRYLDFHKRHQESGLRLWRVTDAGGDLGDKLPYHPDAAMDAVRDQARHFPELLADIAGLGGGVAVCPYDAELFGHWWFEGVAWLEQVLAQTLDGGAITTTTPSRELAAHAPSARVALHEGSWGEEGDHRVWVNDETTWMWEDLRRAEEEVDAALPLLSPARARAALAQLLLLAASDWPFLVTTGSAADYATERFHLHRDRLHELLAGAGDDDDVLPPWTADDLAGLEIDPRWWSEGWKGALATT